MKTLHPLLSRVELLAAFRFLDDIYEQNRNTNIVQRTLFRRFVRILSLVVDCVLAMNAIPLMCDFIYPLFAYFVFHTRELFGPLYWPGMSLNNTVHYVINLLSQSVMGTSVVASYAYFDMLFIVQVLHVKLMTDILCRKIRFISKLATARRHRTPLRDFEMSTRMHNIVDLQHELNE